MSGLNITALRQAIQEAKLPDPAECLFRGPVSEPCVDCGQDFGAPIHKWPEDRSFAVKLDVAYMRLASESERGA